MGYFETFYVKRKDDDGEYIYKLKTIDSEQVESWEVNDDTHTTVFMKSGDIFILNIAIQDFGDIIIDYEDAYGKILVFSKN